MTVYSRQTHSYSNIITYKNMLDKLGSYTVPCKTCLIFFCSAARRKQESRKLTNPPLLTRTITHHSDLASQMKTLVGDPITPNISYARLGGVRSPTNEQPNDR